MREIGAEVVVSELLLPRATGLGSGKEAWKTTALRLVDQNQGLSDHIRDLEAVNRELKAELDLLRRRIAARRPAGGRPPLPDEKVARIEAALRRGEVGAAVARSFRVSKMTVSRIARHMRERDAVRS